MKKESKKAAISPLGDRVLIKPLSEEERGRKLPSGIIIPDTVDKEKPEQGRVVAVGPGRRSDEGELVPISVKIGDTVIFSKYGYDEVKIGDEEYLIVSENNILAIIK
jgi:chaperonin GroES